MERLDYDFNSLEDAVGFVKQNPTIQNLESLKNELNRFWKDKFCKELLFTVNTDKLFFGINIIPFIDDDIVKNILTTNEITPINNYSLEIDSRLFDLRLSTRELLAVLLFEISGVVHSGSVDAIRLCLDTYCASTGVNLPSLTFESRRIIKFGLTQSIRKFNDIFDITDENYISPEFIVRCGYNIELENAVRKIVRTEGVIRIVENKFIALQWCIRMYAEMKYRRLNSIRAINNLIEFTGSELEKRELINLKKSLIDKDIVYEQLHYNESFIDKILDKMSEGYRSFKRDGMKSVEDDLYEYSMRIETLDDADEALQILRSINLRISMIDDYILEQGKHINEDERNRWMDLKSKYLSLRLKLTSTKTYKDKYYGLFVKTPVVSSRYEL